MERFETLLSEATAGDDRAILAAIGAVLDTQGNNLYYFASGSQSLAPDAPPINHKSTFVMGSAGRFISHIAALQCVERGLITLDEPVYYLPELENLEILSRNQGPEVSTRPFLLQVESERNLIPGN